MNLYPGLINGKRRLLTREDRMAIAHLNATIENLQVSVNILRARAVGGKVSPQSRESQVGAGGQPLVEDKK